MKLIVGLGNPGRVYAHNRHNIGFMCLNHFSKTQGIRLEKKQGQSRTGSGRADGVKLMVARPQTYMNLSGEAVGQLVRKFRIDLGDLTVIHDDLDLPVGKIRLRQGGGSGGHNGIASIIARLGSPDFCRIRVGIGRPLFFEGSAGDKETAIIDYVLSDFRAEEKKIMAKVIPVVGQAILCLLTEGLVTAMNEYN
jgi:PTH1 family peptidyl-tRNA hydrolase